MNTLFWSNNQPGFLEHPIIGDDLGNLSKQRSTVYLKVRCNYYYTIIVAIIIAT